MGLAMPNACKIIFVLILDSKDNQENKKKQEHKKFPTMRCISEMTIRNLDSSKDSMHQCLKVPMTSTTCSEPLRTKMSSFQKDSSVSEKALEQHHPCVQVVE